MLFGDVEQGEDDGELEVADLSEGFDRVEVAALGVVGASDEEALVGFREVGEADEGVGVLGGEPVDEDVFDEDLLKRGGKRIVSTVAVTLVC